MIATAAVVFGTNSTHASALWLAELFLQCFSRFCSLCVFSFCGRLAVFYFYSDLQVCALLHRSYLGIGLRLTQQTFVCELLPTPFSSTMLLAVHRSASFGHLNPHGLEQ